MRFCINKINLFVILPLLINLSHDSKNNNNPFVSIPLLHRNAKGARVKWKKMLIDATNNYHVEEPCLCTSLIQLFNNLKHTRILSHFWIICLSQKGTNICIIIIVLIIILFEKKKNCC